MLLIKMLHGLSNLPTAVCINQLAYFLNGKSNLPPNCDGDGDGDGDGDCDGDCDGDEPVLNLFDLLNMVMYASTTSSMLSSHL